MIQSCCGNIIDATYFYEQANNYLKNIDVECTKININIYLDFCQTLKDKGHIDSDTYNKAYKDIIDFYRIYFNLKEKEVKLLLKVNYEERIKEIKLIERENKQSQFIFPQ